MGARPVDDASLCRARTPRGQEKLREALPARELERSVSEVAVVAGADGEAAEHRKDERGDPDCSVHLDHADGGEHEPAEADEMDDEKPPKGRRVPRNRRKALLGLHVAYSLP